MELHYFCLRGLGELPRLMLELTGTAYDSVMYFNSKEYKDIGPFGQMPLLKDPPNLGGGMGTGGWLPQSGSIVRHLARIHGLDGGPDDPLTQAKVDFAFEGSKDIADKKSIVCEPARARSHTMRRNNLPLIPKLVFIHHSPSNYSRLKTAVLTKPLQLILCHCPPALPPPQTYPRMMQRALLPMTTLKVTCTSATPQLSSVTRIGSLLM